jgi:hypothetical protein
MNTLVLLTKLRVTVSKKYQNNKNELEFKVENRVFNFKILPIVSDIFQNVKE